MNNASFTYNISTVANNKSYVEICNKIENSVLKLTSSNQIVDADGSVVKIYKVQDGEITVYNDYETDAVYVNSDVSLSGII